jgi:hypothetical protein
MITWRGLGLLVLVIGLVPFLFTVPFVISADPAQSKSITGYFVWPLLVSAGLTHGFDRLLRRYSHKRHDFMGISVEKWVFIFLAIAVVIAGVWLAEKLGLIS